MWTTTYTCINPDTLNATPNQRLIDEALHSSDPVIQELGKRLDNVIQECAIYEVEIMHLEDRVTELEEALAVEEASVSNLREIVRNAEAVIEDLQRKTMRD